MFLNIILIGMFFCKSNFMTLALQSISKESEDPDDFAPNKRSEYCSNEFFNPNCPPGEQILIESAKYGRMNIGKCIKAQELQSLGSITNDPKYFGCHSDVTSVLHRKCSFSNKCNVEVKDKELNQTTTCHPWVKSHLEVVYQCLYVIQDETVSCRTALSEKILHLIVDRHRGQTCGSQAQPWIIETYKGQTIKISQKVFSKSTGTNSMVCKGVATTIAERRNKRNVTICSGEVENGENKPVLSEEVVFRSKSSSVEIVRLTTSAEDIDVDSSAVRLVLKLEADGCLDIIPPEDTWLKRNNDDIVIGCYSSKHTWYLRCENGKWVGIVSNCSSEHIISDASENSKSFEKKEHSRVTAMSEENQILVIIAISSFGVVVCILIICCGAMFVKRFKTEKSINVAIKESYYRKDTMNFQPFYGPVSHQTLNNGQRDAKEQEGNEDEQKYFVLDETIVEKPELN